ncbi:MAG: hypothetical protein JWL73_1391 [Actinomycetia bacterium]|nr:hypothetical protein [Actinomycetes bacterium]
MFIQVFQAKLRDPALWARQTGKWRREVRPQTTGFLGYTTGVTADGQMVTVVRFESPEAAKVDNDRPEQGAWFEETQAAFDGDVTFHDCTEVDVFGDGGTNDAGFVQVMQGRAKDQEQMRAAEREIEPRLRELRPEVTGGTIAWHGDGGFTQTVYFTSQEAARKGEAAMAETDLPQRLMAMVDGDLAFFDLTSPAFE